MKFQKFNGSIVFNRVVFFTALVIFCLPVLAQDWSITTADLKTEPVAIVGLSSAGLLVKPAAGADPAAGQTIPLNRIVSLQCTRGDPPFNSPFTLLLGNGQRIAGTPSRFENERVIWRNELLGELSIPSNRLVALVRGTEMPSFEAPAKQDIATLSNGDVLAGVFTSMTSDSLTLQTDAGPASVPLSSVARVRFAATSAPTERKTPGFLLKLVDGSTVGADDCSIDSGNVKFHLTGQPAAGTVGILLLKVVSIEQLNGPVSWLSSRTPTENVQTPYFGGSRSWPARFDLSVNGSPLTVEGRIFGRGIGVHSYSRLSFTIDPGWKSFRTQYGIDSNSKREGPSLADVTVRIQLDNRVVHEQEHVRAGPLSEPITIDLTGAKTITLEADYGDGADAQDHLDWIEPALTR